jgi:hypothetical protein
MIILCPANCTNHVDFPHYVVICEWTGKVNGTRVTIARTFVLCRACRHWIERKNVKCVCASGCHNENIKGMIVQTIEHA